MKKRKVKTLYMEVERYMLTPVHIFFDTCTDDLDYLFIVRSSAFMSMCPIYFQIFSKFEMLLTEINMTIASGRMINVVVVIKICS